MIIETWKIPENDDHRKGTVHDSYWMALDTDSGLEMPGKTEEEAVENLKGNLQ